MVGTRSWTSKVLRKIPSASHSPSGCYPIRPYSRSIYWICIPSETASYPPSFYPSCSHRPDSARRRTFLLPDPYPFTDSDFSRSSDSSGFVKGDSASFFRNCDSRKHHFAGVKGKRWNTNPYFQWRSLELRRISQHFDCKPDKPTRNPQRWRIQNQTGRRDRNMVECRDRTPIPNGFLRPGKKSKTSGRRLF